MKYKNAKTVLPERLLRELQQYVIKKIIHGGKHKAYEFGEVTG